MTTRLYFRARLVDEMGHAQRCPRPISCLIVLTADAALVTAQTLANEAMIRVPGRALGLQRDAEFGSKLPQPREQLRRHWDALLVALHPDLLAALAGNANRVGAVPPRGLDLVDQLVDPLGEGVVRHDRCRVNREKEHAHTLRPVELVRSGDVSREPGAAREHTGEDLPHHRQAEAAVPRHGEQRAAKRRRGCGRA